MKKRTKRLLGIAGAGAMVILIAGAFAGPQAATWVWITEAGEFRFTNRSDLGDALFASDRWDDNEIREKAFSMGVGEVLIRGSESLERVA